jgi:hypothetical protein
MQRCELIAGLVSTIAAAPVFGLRLASAQQAEKVRRVGVLMGSSESSSRGLVDAIRGGTGAIGLGGRPQCAVRAAVDKWGYQPRECLRNGPGRSAA